MHSQTPDHILDQEAEVIGVRLPQSNIEDQTESDLSELKSVKTKDIIKILVVNKRVSEGLAYSSESRSDIVRGLYDIVSRGIPYMLPPRHYTQSGYVNIIYAF